MQSDAISNPSSVVTLTSSESATPRPLPESNPTRSTTSSTKAGADTQILPLPKLTAGGTAGRTYDSHTSACVSG